MTVETAYEYLFRFALMFMALFLIVSFYRCVKGPETCDRLMSVNMTTTAVVSCLAILSVLLNEEYVCDICLIYVLISFLSVAIVAKVYINKGTGVEE